MKYPRLAGGTRVQVRSILITEVFGNMQISASPSLVNTIVVERADIDDLVAAIDQHLAKGVNLHVGSIRVVAMFRRRGQRELRSMRVSTTHTPSNAITVEPADVDDLLVALKEALAHLERETTR